MSASTDLAVFMLSFCFIAEAPGVSGQFHLFCGNEEATLYDGKFCGEGLIDSF